MPRYLQLAEELRQSILSEKFADGTQFPTETSLCKTYDVSRFTVREALRRLEAEGLIQRKRGSGTTVQSAGNRRGALHQPLSSLSEILQYARGSAAVYYPIGEGPLPEEIADEIDAETDGQWYCVSGLRQQGYDEQPLALTTAYFHERLGKAVHSLDLIASPKPLFKQIEQSAGVRASKVTQDLQAVSASAEIAKRLDVPVDSPVLRVLRCFIDDKGQVYEIVVNHHPGDRFVYSMNMNVNG